MSATTASAHDFAPTSSTPASVGFLGRSKATTAARRLLGLLFVVFGLNGFLGFMPQPPLNAEAGALMGAFAAAGYMFPLIKGTEVVAGLLLFSARTTPLGLLLLAPVVVNITAFHLFLAGGPAMSFAIIGLGVFTAWGFRDRFAPLFAEA